MSDPKASTSPELIAETSSLKVDRTSSSAESAIVTSSGRPATHDNEAGAATIEQAEHTAEQFT
jgi:hypothetical protein